MWRGGGSSETTLKFLNTTKTFNGEKYTATLTIGGASASFETNYWSGAITLTNWGTLTASADTADGEKILENVEITCGELNKKELKKKWDGGYIWELI